MDSWINFTLTQDRQNLASSLGLSKVSGINFVARLTDLKHELRNTDEGALRTAIMRQIVGMHRAAWALLREMEDACHSHVVDSFLYLLDKEWPFARYTDFWIEVGDDLLVFPSNTYKTVLDEAKLLIQSSLAKDVKKREPLERPQAVFRYLQAVATADISDDLATLSRHAEQLKSIGRENDPSRLITTLFQESTEEVKRILAGGVTKNTLQTIFWAVPEFYILVPFRGEQVVLAHHSVWSAEIVDSLVRIIAQKRWRILLPERSHMYPTITVDEFLSISIVGQEYAVGEETDATRSAGKARISQTTPLTSQASYPDIQVTKSSKTGVSIMAKPELALK